jgi:hypothetical protein
MAIPRRRLALAVGSLALLTIVGVGLVQARSVQPAVASSVATTAAGDAPTNRPDAGVRAALRLAARGRIVHGTVTIDTPKNGLITVQVDGGTISAVDADSVTIAEKGGGSVTVAIDSDTRVRRERKRATAGDLKVGDTVRVVSRLADGGSATAKLIVVTPPKAS